MRKYGIDKFNIDIIEVCDSLEDMIKKEEYYCSLYDAYNKGYNMTTAGEVNPMECVESKIKHDNIMSSTSVREKISKSLKEYKKNNKVSDETRKKLSENKKGEIQMHKGDIRISVKTQEEVSRKIKEGWSIGGLKRTPEHSKAVIDSLKKKVMCLTDYGEKKEFDSLKEACEWWVTIIPKSELTDRMSKNSYALADDIKKSSKKDKFIKRCKWYYI